MNLNSTNGGTMSSNYWSYNGNPQMTDTHFSLGSTYDETNNTSRHYVAYLFASLDGISKLGGYTGDGTTAPGKAIDCGFSGSARFVFIKNVSASVGNWSIWDTTRGITTTPNSYWMRFNGTSAQNNSYDWMEPYTGGFRAGYGFDGNSPNNSGDYYMFWAIA